MSIHKILTPSPFLFKYVRSYALQENGDGETCRIRSCEDDIQLQFLISEKIIDCYLHKFNLSKYQPGLSQRNNEDNSRLTLPAKEQKKKSLIIILKKEMACFFPGLPTKKANEVIDGANFFGDNGRIFYTQLQNASDIVQVTVFSNLFLMSILMIRNDNPALHAVTAAANLMINNPDLINIEQLATESFMSLRNFQRRFFEQMGISPKLFSRIARFNRAVEIKKTNPDKKWANIAYDCGYCNHTHFIREFKLFSGRSPNAYLKTSGLLY